MQVLDLVEFDGFGVDAAVERVVVDPAKPVVHAAVARWIGHAVNAYVGSALHDEADVGVSGLRPLRDLWVVQSATAGAHGREVYEVCAWGRRYETADGRLRVLRLPTVPMKPRDRSRAEIAVAAFVAASGNRVADQWNPQPYPVGVASRAQRVRVVEISCADVAARVIFDGSVDEAVELYLRHGQEPLRRARVVVPTHRGATASIAN